jgi:membrane protein CcdC involved in cytochrome C biogenesis
MIAPLSLSDLATVVFAVLCLMTIAPQARGRVVKVWRLAVPPCFAAVEDFMLLASVFDANLQNDAEWLLAAMLGLLFGRMRGWSVLIEVDQQHELIRQQRTADGPLVAIALLLLALTDFIGAALLDPVVEPQHVAAGAALCAGYLGGRALAIAVRTTRLPHVELYRA